LKSKSNKFLKKIADIINRGIDGEYLSIQEGLSLWNDAPLGLMMAAADNIRYNKHPGNSVTWIIDRNVNITNICMSMCTFCNFCRPRNSPEAYITTSEQYHQKIDEMVSLGGEQLLLQGGMHPGLGLDFYVDLFKELKSYYPYLKLHALGPPEIVHLAKKEGSSYREILQALVDAGLDSLPGAGAEILSDRVRKKLSPKKATVQEWLDVMREAHRMNMVTSATMMFGHIETVEERIDHLIKIREVHREKPENSPGFLSFIPWPFQEKNTVLLNKFGIHNSVTGSEYIRFIALSRLMLPDISNIQASWLTVGKETAQICLHAGANDFGSIMIEENVVSGAGANNSFNSEGIKQAITEAGFIPRQRNQRFEYV
jgi:cyclic dehypoxanthinyl futalosine synthase